MAETLLDRLNEPWSRIDGASARKINRLLADRREAAERIVLLETALTRIASIKGSNGARFIAEAALAS